MSEFAVMVQDGSPLAVMVMGGEGPPGGATPELQALIDQAARLQRPTRPAPPPGPAAIVSVTDLATPGIPTNGSDAAAAINAALTSTGICILEPGVRYGAASAVLRPSGSKLLCRDGSPARIEALPGFSGGAGNAFNAVVCNLPGATDLTVYNIIMDVAGIGAGSDPTRINGLKNFGARRTRTQQCEVRRISGYGFFDQFGVANGDTMDNLYDRCGGSDCSYAFEQMGAVRTYAVDCWADAGAGTQNLVGMIHPVTGSTGVSFIRFTGRGGYLRGISIIANEGRVIDGLYFEDLDIDATGGAASIQVEGDAETRNLLLINSRIRGKQGALLSRTRGRLIASRLEAASASENVTALALTNGSMVEVDAASQVDGRTTAAGGSVFGVTLDASSALAFDGDITGFPGAGGGYFPISGPGLQNVELGSGAELVPGGTVTTESGLLDADPSHLGGTVRFAASYPQSYRLLADTSDTTLPVGVVIKLERLGAGPVTVTAGAGVTLTAPDGAVLDTALATGRVVRSGANAWTFAKDNAVPATPPGPVVIPDSVPLQTHGSGLTLSGLNPDGTYTLTGDATAGAYRSISSVDSLTGDLFLEFTPLAAPPAMSMGFDDAAGSAFRGTAELNEAFQTEGGGGGPTWLGAWKAGAFTGPFVRSGSIFQTRVSGVWNLYTGADWEAALAAGPLHTSGAVDNAARYLSSAEIGASPNVKIRFCAYPA